MTETGAADGFDVVIAGGGLAGLCAGLAAAEAGRAALILEKTAAPGGSTLLSGGGFAFAGIDIQADTGVEDDSERLRGDILRVGRSLNDSAQVDAYVAGQLETYEWLKRHGVRFSSLQAGGGNSVPRVARTLPHQVIAALAERVREHPACTLMPDAAVSDFLIDPESGAVCGVRAAIGGTERTIAARHGIVLATGGFSKGPAMLARYAPDKAGAFAVGGPGCTGDGLSLATGLGAAVRDMDQIKGTFGYRPDPDGGEGRLLFAIYKGAIAVNRAGRRFIDESAPYKDVGDACLLQPGAVAFQLFDRQVIRASDPDAITYDFKRALDDGLLMSADTIEALAARLGIDPPGLVATVRAYNAGLESGDHAAGPGRSALPGGRKPPPLCEPPYHAFESRVGLLGTYCGIAIDGRARVIDTAGWPIPGLYAAGEVTGGLHGAGYISGTALGKAAIFGRIAGREASRFRAARPAAAL